MIRKTIVAVALAVLLPALAATLSPPERGGAPEVHDGVRRVLPVDGDRRPGRGQRLGMRYIVAASYNLGGEQGAIRYYKSLIARHVDAIATGGYDPALEPIFRKVPEGGDPADLVGDDIAGKRDLWVNYSARPPSPAPWPTRSPPRSTRKANTRSLTSKVSSPSPTRGRRTSRRTSPRPTRT
jgi:hypothetical protein